MRQLSMVLYRFRAVLGVIPVSLGIIFHIFDSNHIFSKYMLYLGTFVLTIGLVFRIWTSMYNWIDINSSQPEASNGLITNGPYCYCRNPMYLSIIIMTLGLSLIFGSVYVTVIMVIPTIILHLHQIYIEEKFLITLCSEEYKNYKEEVPRLLPYRGKVNVKPYGKPNWKHGLRNDAGPIFGGLVFVCLVFILSPFLKFDYCFIALTFGLTIIINIVIVGKIKKSGQKIKSIPSTAPIPVLLQPLRFLLFRASDLIQLLKINANDEQYNVLDLGCGPGYYTLPIAEDISGTVYAVDIREKMISKLMQRAQKKRINNIQTIVADASQLPLPDQSISLIILNLVIGEIVNKTLAVDECFRVLKPKGRMSVMESIFDDHYQTVEEVKLVFSCENWSSEIIEKKRTYYIVEFTKR